MYTSYFAKVKSIREAQPDLKLVSIAVGTPRYFRGSREKRLAPTRDMLKLSREEYDHRFEAILAALDPHELFEALGENAVLLCYEKANTYCHRRRVAEWFEESLGIVVPEFGFERADILPYTELPEKKVA